MIGAIDRHSPLLIIQAGLPCARVLVTCAVLVSVEVAGEFGGVTDIELVLVEQAVRKITKIRLGDFIGRSIIWNATQHWSSEASVENCVQGLVYIYPAFAVHVASWINAEITVIIMICIIHEWKAIG